ncbi:MAG: hypothetical protein KGO53_09380 [Alphaproteobacteria bacterium]|nr:hypothetical protein [Alphaproteobacteria bacterium]
MRSFLAFGFLTLSATAAMAQVATPGPVIGVVAGPWGVVAMGLGYGAYRAYKALR